MSSCPVSGSADGDGRAVALLVLLARAAGAGVVASDLQLLLLGSRDLRPGTLHLGRRRERDPGRRLLLPPPLLEELLLGHRLVAEQPLDDVVLHPVLHRLEEVEALL